jgi:glycosyltransferase involved in cell wall biosynthesis
MKASILINNYNHGKYLRFAIDSALNQTYHDVEVIVYDDGSTDDSEEIIRSYGNKIISILPGKNHGKGHIFNQINAVNQAFLKASGEYIFLLDSDDGFLPNKIEECLLCFNKDIELSMVQHPLSIISSSGEVSNDLFPFKERLLSPFPKRITQKLILNYHALLGLYMPTSGLGFRRSWFEKYFPMLEDPYSKITVDSRITRLAGIYGKIFTIHDPLGFYRIHGSNFSFVVRDKDKNHNMAAVQELFDYLNEFNSRNNLPLLSYNTYRFKKYLFKLSSFFFG